jgi:hypothetical protein
MRLSALVSVLVVCLISLSFSQSKSDIPRVIRYSGTLKNADGSPRAGTVGVSFAIYAEELTTAPLWQEVQNVTVDETGHYSVLLGAARAEGLPDGLFATNEARWLGIRVENEPEQPRTILAAVPYALKAADAETLGGRPVSAFVLNQTAAGERTVGAQGEGTPSGSIGVGPLSINTSGSSGTQNFLAMWTDNAGTLGNSALSQSGNNVGIGNTTPTAPLQVGPDFTLSGAWPTMGYNLYYNGEWKYATNGSGSLLQQDYANNGLRIAVAPPGTAGSAATLVDGLFVAGSGNVGVGTTSPSAPLQIGPDFTLSGAWPTMGFNLYYNGGWKYATTNSGSIVQQDYANNGLSIAVAAAGTAGAAASATSALFVADTGNVGLGTTAPAQKLDVAGNIHASGNVAATGTISGSNLSATGTATFTGAPSGTGVSNGALYVNPASATAGQTLFGVAVGGVQKMLVDAGGNLSTAGALAGTSLALPATTSSTNGVITLGGTRFVHNYGSGNTFLGKAAGNFSATGTLNTAVGENALQWLSSGAMNTATGLGALLFDNTGSSNAAFGFQALNQNGAGNTNVAVGAMSLWNNAGGSSNVSVGANSMYSNQSGAQNVAVGASALSANVSGSWNTAIGHSALGATTGTSAAGRNTAVGAASLSFNTTGAENVALGMNALYGNTTGSDNIGVGSGAGSNATTGNWNIFIGNTGQAGDNSTIRIGQSGVQTQTYIAGTIHGDGSGLTGVTATLPSNVALKDAANSFTAAQTITTTATALTATGGAYGVSGTSTNGNGTGVYGNGDGQGVFGVSAGGWGVFGRSGGISFSGVAGSNTSSGYGVYGTSTGGTGVRGDSTSAAGVYGSSTNSTGVYGYGLDGVFGVGHNGVHGSGNGGANALAGYFEGNVSVTGTLTKSGGSFKIDHPLDPANKYLSHSFVESPDMKNVYDGVVVLDADGQAWVSLPEWFEALNRDFRYQLTAIGSPGPNLYIAQEVSGNRFQIAGGRPGSKVSWQVTGIRHDAWANDHRIGVEEEKMPDDRERYLYPQGFGQPGENAIGKLPIAVPKPAEPRP